jgi:hypothetical protein
VNDENQREPINHVFHSDIQRQSNPPAYPNRFNQDRCLLLIRCVILLALGATMFQIAMLIRLISPSNLILLPVYLMFSILLFVGWLIDLQRILKLRAESKRMNGSSKKDLS